MFNQFRLGVGLGGWRNLEMYAGMFPNALVLHGTKVFNMLFWLPSLSFDSWSVKLINPKLIYFQEPPSPRNSIQPSSTHEDIEMQSTRSPPQPQPLHKHRGYPALATFIGSDKDFFIFRKFNVLSARNLLFLQDELSELEEELNAIDLVELRRGDLRDLRSLSSRREDENLERKKLMGLLSVKIKEYRMWWPKTILLQLILSR